MESVRLLVVDDDEMDRVLVRSAVEADGREVREEATMREGRAALSEATFDLVVLDLFLPDGDGRELLAELRERPRSANVPVVVLSARGTRAVKAECFRRGADEFFEKPVEPEVLSAAVDRQLERARAVTSESGTDPLTGLPNRAGMSRRFEESRALALEIEAPLPVGYLAVDGFEALEEALDRRTLDGVLEAFARTLREVLPEAMIVGRWRRGEFVVLAPGASPGDARGRLDDALGALRERPPSRPDGGDDGEAPLHLVFSAGVVDGRPFATLRRALFEAEPALRAARTGGGGRAVAGDSGADDDGESGSRILVVEDDEVGAELVKHRLERSGFAVECLATGTEARATIESLDPPPFDLLLFDFKLPGADGLELLQLAKKRERWSDLPVVILTSLGREEDIVRAFELGADDYILKPFSPAELLARIHRLLRRS